MLNHTFARKYPVQSRLWPTKVWLVNGSTEVRWSVGRHLFKVALVMIIVVLGIKIVLMLLPYLTGAVLPMSGITMYILTLSILPYIRIFIWRNWPMSVEWVNGGVTTVLAQEIRESCRADRTKRSSYSILFNFSRTTRICIFLSPKEPR